jgi:hypothetical protein
MGGNTGSVTHTYHVVPRLISIGDAAVVEGDTGKFRSLRFPVTLSGPSSQPVTVQWAVRTTGSASSEDVVVKTGTVTFKPSPTSGLTKTVRYVTTKVFADTDVEGDQTFQVVLSDPTGEFALARATGTGTILDDDPIPGSVPTVNIGDATIVEGTAGALSSVKLTVSLSAPATAPVSVQVVVSDGTATVAGRDYKRPKVYTVSFSPGQWQKTVGVSVYADPFDEPDEMLTAALTGASVGLGVGRGVGTVTIVNDD